MPFATTWVDLEIIVLTERHIVYDISYISNLKCGTSEHIYKIKADLQMWRTDLRKEWGIWG